MLICPNKHLELIFKKISGSICFFPYYPTRKDIDQSYFRKSLIQATYSITFSPVEMPLNRNNLFLQSYHLSQCIGIETAHAVRCTLQKHNRVVYLITLSDLTLIHCFLQYWLKSHSVTMKSMEDQVVQEELGYQDDEVCMQCGCIPWEDYMKLNEESTKWLTLTCVKQICHLHI